MVALHDKKYIGILHYNKPQYFYYTPRASFQFGSVRLVFSSCKNKTLSWRHPMKYSCKLCKVIIKYKTSSGWIDHIRGVTHQRNRSKVLGSSFLSLLDTLVAQKKLTHTEHREIQEKYTPGMDSREVAEMVRRVLRGHMMDRHSG